MQKAHRQRDCGGERGIHRVAAFQHHAQPGLCSERLRGRDDVAREYRHALREVGKIPGEIFHIVGMMSYVIRAINEIQRPPLHSSVD